MKLLYSFLFFLVLSCSEKGKTDTIRVDEPLVSNLSGKDLANMHCARCHLFVAPKVLPKSIWEEDILPAMGFRMGIYKENHQRDSLLTKKGGTLLREANIYPENPVLAKEDWDKIETYYVNNAPDTIVTPIRIDKIAFGLKHFTYKESLFSEKFPLTSMVKIEDNNKGFVFSNADRNMNSLTFLTAKLEKEYKLNLRSTPIHYREKLDTIYLTTIGTSIFPYDGFDGTIQKLYKTGDSQNYNAATVLISKMQRPVFVEYQDLNNDGLEDILASEYGNLIGNLVWYENAGGDSYVKHVLRAKPGAIKTVVKDIDNDGLKDIFALMAQGDEGIFLYKNKGDGKFIEKRLLSFSPLNGSQYMQLADFNNDGFEDILYVCGDNADKTPILKDYHGVYVFINDGAYNFKQAYFYHLNGAYKAIPRDYDLDGDIDMAVISFFPDYINNAEESFVYLENKGNLKFSNYSFPESTNGRWMVMDANDMDSDGDDDLILGSFVFFQAKGDTTGLGEKWLSGNSPSIVVLENTIR